MPRDWQTMYASINNGATVPWIWSVIEFDQNGNSVNTGSTANYQIFPTYNVYVNGHLNNTIPQSAVASVIQLNGSSQLLPPPQ